MSHIFTKQLMSRHTLLQMFLVLVAACLGSAQSRGSFLKPPGHVTVLAAQAAPSIAASRSAREACPYWNAIGVLDDHLELMCQGQGAFRLGFQLDAEESLAMACCPTPYEACKIS